MNSWPSLQRVLWTLTIAYWCILFIVTHIPGEALPNVKLNDKIEHFLAYGALGGLFFLSLWASRPDWQRLPLIVLGILAVYGAVDEGLQAIPFIRRNCSLWDWCADVIGVGIAVMFLGYLRRR